MLKFHLHGKLEERWNHGSWLFWCASLKFLFFLLILLILLAHIESYLQET